MDAGVERSGLGAGGQTSRAWLLATHPFKDSAVTEVSIAGDRALITQVTSMVSISKSDVGE
jgi:hypothetical protein